MTVAKEPGHRGERDISRKTIACGNAGRSGVLVVTRVRSTTTIAHETAGASGTRHSPRPSLGREINADLGRTAPRGRDRVFDEFECAAILVERSDDSLQAPSFRDGPKDQARNLEIPGSMLRIAPE